MSVVGEVLKKVPWAQIGGLSLTVIGATFSSIAQRRNQEIMIEKVGAQVAKEVIKQQEKILNS